MKKNGSRISGFASLLVFAALLAPPPAWGGLAADTGFSGDGYVTVDPNTDVDSARAVAVQGDNKVVMVGLDRTATNDNVVVVRLNTDGTLDTSFDTDGIAITLPGTPSALGGGDGRAVAIQSDGKIVVAGYYNPNDGTGKQLLLIRYNTNGSLDSSFGTGGVVISTLFAFGQCPAESVALQSDGKIIVAGNGTNPSNFSNGLPGYVARFTTTGGLDDTFATAGVYTAASSVVFNAVKVLGDDSIIAGGTHGDNQDFILTKLSSSGAPVAGFGTSGVAVINSGTYDSGFGILNNNDSLEAIAVLGDGSILGAGHISTLTAKATVVKFTSAGAVDTTFGASGYFKHASAGGPFYAIVGLSDGSMVAAGLCTSASCDLAGVQISSDGLTSASLSGISAQAINGLAVDGNGKVVGAGEANVSGANYRIVGERMTASAIGGASDTTPDAFVFTDQSGVAQATPITSNTITVSGINAPAAISIANGGGTYSKNGGSFTSTAGTVSNGDTVAVKVTSSALLATAVSTTLTIGGVQDTFTVTTTDAVIPDTTPDAFSFTDATDADPEAVVVSNPITVTGINAATEISVLGGEYQVGSGAFTASPGTVTNNQTVTVRGTAGTYEGLVDVVLTIGGVADTFSITSRAANVDNVSDSHGDNVVVSSVDGTLSNLQTVSKPAEALGSFKYPNGFFAFDITGLVPGATTDVTITLPSGATPDAYVKCTPSACAVFPGANIVGNVVTLTLTDGGAGDADGVADGTITDPGAPATTFHPAASGGGGGAVDWMTLLIGLSFAVRRRRR